MLRRAVAESRSYWILTKFKSRGSTTLWSVNLTQAHIPNFISSSVRFGSTSRLDSSSTSFLGSTETQTSSNGSIHNGIPTKNLTTNDNLPNGFGFQNGTTHHCHNSLTLDKTQPHENGHLGSNGHIKNEKLPTLEKENFNNFIDSKTTRLLNNYTSTDPQIGLFSRRSLLGVTLSSLSIGMAAIGITSAQDWLSFFAVASQLGTIFLALFAIYHYRALYIFSKTVLRDIRGGFRYAKILVSVALAQRSNSTVHSIFVKNASRHPDKICFYFEDEVWTFKKVDEYSNQIGNYFTKQGLKKGDSVSLFMENRPQYICLWLGLCKIGVVPALINFNLRLQPLKHSVEVAKSQALIYGHELSDSVTDILNMGGLETLPLYSSGHEKAEDILHGAIDLDHGLKFAPISRPIPSEPINFTDKLLYIFTSGTTGLPKAAVIKHSRYIMATIGSHIMMGMCSQDTLYAPFPLYHTVGIALGVGQSLLYGCPVILRRKFSASQFWKDCTRYGATAAQYIGEICRYLLSQPNSPLDTQHKVKLMFGNGLRPQIWSQFAQRFNIKTISEFYGATEGNCNIVNIDNHVGAVGFISRIVPFIYPVTLIKIDDITGEPIRDPRSGLVIRCRPNEDGELVGRIVENHPVREFQGYADSTATTKKIVHDVFRKGDAAFRTGDILMMDEFGYFYFKDRTGDTYRWRGENVSTSEVEAVVSSACQLKDAVVYGVEIPGTEGRAGMAAILDPHEDLDFVSFTEQISESLPSYARPMFVRIVKEMDMTGTYKMKKFDLQKDGFDVTKISDKIYILLNGKYVPFDNEMYSNVIKGELRF